ncbi:MAG: hypothetical protein U0929_13930 [Planctomycetaceae bacterium]
MWCPRCHTEVAAEIAQNGQSLNCTSCGTEIQRIYAPSLHPDTRSARELLERWSKGDGLEIASALPATSSVSSTNTPGPFETAAAAATSVPTELVAQATPPAVNAQVDEEAPPATFDVAATTEMLEVAAEDKSLDAGNAVRRDRPDRSRPERQAPKPRTTWRVDSAHTVTQPVAPPPPPVPPRRPHFATPGAEADKAPVAQKKSETPANPIVSTKAASIRPIEPIKTTPPEAVKLGPPEPLLKAAPERAPVAKAIEAPPAVEQPVATDGPPEQHEPTHVAPRSPRPATASRAKQHRLDPAHESLIGPHFDLQAFLSQDARKPGRSESMWGQVLAYLGVGLITVGTTMVLWSYFGKSPQHASYAPTGWLICTVGQMLLFLGVTTLISGGMQQTSHEVTRRVEYIGDRMLRFEQSAEQLLRGPHFNEMRQRSKGKAKAAHVVEEHDNEIDSDA